jgi:hypothetical protein
MTIEHPVIAKTTIAHKYSNIQLSTNYSYALCVMRVREETLK